MRCVRLMGLFVTLAISGACGSDSACPGDCDGDGQVTEAELATAVDILGGVQSLDVCPTADSDGDGHVFGNEISLIVSGGCA